MSDDIDTLLDKLIQIQWESVVSNEEIPGVPIEFQGTFNITPGPDNLIDGKKNYLVDNLKNTGEVEINLRELDFTNRFDDFWRIRIERLTMVLYNKEGQLIQSPGNNFGETIRFRIRYPTLFNDTDFRKNSVSFLAQNFQCNSDYTTDGSEINFESDCSVTEDFSMRDYKPSVDGVFSFKIENPGDIDMESVSQLAVNFFGSRIRFNTKDKMIGDTIVW